MRSDPYEPTSTGIGVGRGGAATQNAAHLDLYLAHLEVDHWSVYRYDLLLVGIELLVAVGSSPYLGSRDVCEEFRTRDTCRIRR